MSLKVINLFNDNDSLKVIEQNLKQITEEEKIKLAEEIATPPDNSGSPGGGTLVFHSYLSENKELLDGKIDIYDLPFSRPKARKINCGYRIVFFYEEFYQVGAYAREIAYFMEDMPEFNVELSTEIPEFISNENLLDRYLTDKPDLVGVAIYNIDGTIIQKKKR